MSTQDWTTTVLVNKKAMHEKQKKNSPTTIRPTTNSNAIGTSTKVIEDGDVHKINTIGHETGQKIMQARTAKNMSQKDVANKINIPVSEFQKIENGTMKRNGELLNRLGKVLGVKLTGKGM